MAMVFDGLTAWFSSSVCRKWIDVWLQNGGKLDGYDSASILFSEDNSARDTQKLLGHKYYFGIERAVLHPAYIGACVSLDSLDSVIATDYQILPHELMEAFREKHVAPQTLKHKAKSNVWKGEITNRRKCDIRFRQESNSEDLEDSAHVSEVGSSDGLDWGLFLRCVGYVESSMLGRVNGELEVVRISDDDCEYNVVASSSKANCFGNAMKKQRWCCNDCNNIYNPLM